MRIWNVQSSACFAIMVLTPYVVVACSVRAIGGVAACLYLIEVAQVRWRARESKWARVGGGDCQALSMEWLAALCNHIFSISRWPTDTNILIRRHFLLSPLANRYISFWFMAIFLSLPANGHEFRFIAIFLPPIGQQTKEFFIAIFLPLIGRQTPEFLLSAIRLLISAIRHDAHNTLQMESLQGYQACPRIQHCQIISWNWA